MEEKQQEKRKGKFVHLHVHTEYSLLDGASRIPDLVATAKELGMDAVAMTDHGVMYGTIAFYKEAKKQGIKPIIGCEVYVAPRSRKEQREVDGRKYHHLILLAENNLGYRNLIQLVSQASIDGMYYRPRVDKELLRQHHEGIICLSACIAGEIPRAVIAGQMEVAERLTEEYLEIFGKNNFFLEIQNHGIPEEQIANEGLIALSEKYKVGLVATNDAHYVRKADSELHDVLLCIQMNKKLDDPTRMKFFSDDFYLKSPEEMAALFRTVPSAIENSVKIAERCQVDFEFGKLQLPYYPIPEEYRDATAYLRSLCEEKIHARYDVLTDEIKERLDFELGIIKTMGYDSYFLIVWDFIDYAKSKGIAVGPGRGSAAGSIVAYILGITDIDPLKYALLFERFLNPERVTMPDIDIDFCYIRREEVIDYVKKRYGEDHVAQIVTFGTMAAKGAIRAVGRVLGMEFSEASKVAELIPMELKMTIDKAMKNVADLQKMYESDDRVKKLIDLARKIEGLPSHSSTHAAGVVIAKSPLTDYVPVQVVDGTLVTEYDKDFVEELGLLKMDFLGLRTLTVIADTLEQLKKIKGITVDLTKLPLEDDKTAKMLCEGKTGAVFQMESAGMTSLMKELQPEGFTDLIALVALYRPGPLGSGMVEDFIGGRHGTKEVSYLHPLLEPILKETFGVILYQEQVMQIVQVLAGFTLGQADLLRRAMGKKKHEILMAQKENFLAGCRERKVDEALANKIFDLLTHFADYGFNKSHSAAYALVAWQTAYLKAHYPAEFMAAMLSSVIETNKVSTYLELAKRMKIKVLPPDINASVSLFSVDGEAIRFGLAAVRNVGEKALRDVLREREEHGAYTSFVDFCGRTDRKTLNKKALESLIKCGAFDTLGARRSQLLEVIDRVVAVASKAQSDREYGQIGLFDDVEDAVEEIILPDIPEASSRDILKWEKENTGFYITGHPLDFYEKQMRYLPRIAEILTKNLKNKQVVRVGGIFAETKKLTTRKGDTMCFAVLEDFTERIEVTIFPRTFYEHVKLIAVDTPVVIQGRIDILGDEVKILADQISPIEDYISEYYLMIPDEMNQEEAYGKLQKIFEEHHGKHPVTVRIGGRWTKMQEALYLTDSDEVIEVLQNLLGEENVRLR